ncbi:hypothetical protein D3C86_1282090 [compost metagenome]
MGQGPAGQPRQVQLRPRRGGVLPRQPCRLRGLQGRRIRLLHREPGEELGQRLQHPGRRARRHRQGRDPPPDPDPDPGAVHEQPPRPFRRRPGARGHGPAVRFRVEQPHAVQQRLQPGDQLLPQQRVRRPRHPAGRGVAAAFPLPRAAAERTVQQGAADAADRRQRPAARNPAPRPRPARPGRLEILRRSPAQQSRPAAALRDPAGQPEPRAHPPALPRQPRAHRRGGQPAHRRSCPVQAAHRRLRLRHGADDPAADAESRP